MFIYFTDPICYKLDEVGTTTALMSVAQSSKNVSSPSFPKIPTDKDNYRTTDTQGYSIDFTKHDEIIKL